MLDGPTRVVHGPTRVVRRRDDGTFMVMCCRGGDEPGTNLVETGQAHYVLVCHGCVDYEDLASRGA